MANCRSSNALLIGAWGSGRTATRFDPRCRLHIVDLQTGDAVRWVRIEVVVSELNDVVALPGVRQPQALGFKSDEVRRVLWVGEEHQL